VDAAIVIAIAESAQVLGFILRLLT